MNTKPLTIILVLLLAPLANAQIVARETIDLWPDKAPTTQTAERDDGTGRFYNVSRPVLYVWPAENPTGVAIIACPGGSYDHVTMEIEAQRIAKWLNPMGVTVFGLKYHTKPPSQDAAADALADGQRAVRLVRAQAGRWKIDPRRIGVLGYSAGANLVLNLASHFDAGQSGATDEIDRQACRPDFAVMLSTWPNRLTIDSFPLSKDSPPTFIAIAKDDRTAPPPFTADIKKKLDELEVPAQLYEAEKGGHGAFHLDAPGVDIGWKEPFLGWMKGR